MKNYLLTDFNTEKWKGINMESVETQIEKLNEKINENGCLFGVIENPEIFKVECFLINPETFDIPLSKASHIIKNLTFNDGKVYGDVKFLNNDYGKYTEILINNMKGRFDIRCALTSEKYKNSEIVIHSIFTWNVINSKNKNRKTN